MKLRAGISLYGLLILSLTFAGCNIFSFAGDPDVGEDILDEGLEYMLDGEFDSAKVVFARGLETDPLNSDLLYNHAKATLLSSNLSIITIVNELQKFDENSGIGSEVPFLSLGWPFDQDTMYVTNIVIFNDLEPIFDGRTTGSISKKDISLDIFIANTVKGILRIADTNNDGTITKPEDIELNFLSTADGFAFDSTLFETLEPEDLNNLIDNVTDIISGNSEFAEEFFGETSIDTASIDSLMNEITGSIEWYYVNTFIEGNPALGIPDVGDSTNPGNSINGGDNDFDGFADDECIDGDDNDRDGLFDEDAVIKGGLAWFKDPVTEIRSQVLCP